MPERRGVLLIDEMKLTPGVWFDSSTLNVQGFVDLVEKVPDEMGEGFNAEVQEALKKLPSRPAKQMKATETRRKNKAERAKNDRSKNLGDHALVLSFQPFRGKWVQVLASFLTRGSVTHENLTKLVLEAVLLVEKTGLYVDGIVTDGATWNRSMWEDFGVTEQSPGVEHPSDPLRKLWFLSDLPHLLKCMRNCFLDKKVIETPEGAVKLEHWEAIIKADSLKEVGLRECHKLTEDHLNPDYSQKMKVRMAFQFWSRSAAAAMECYKFQGCDVLQDCKVSKDFCKKINDMTDIMNTSTPKRALKPKSEESKLLEEFLQYFICLLEWTQEKLDQKVEKANAALVEFAKKQGRKVLKKDVTPPQKAIIFSESTDYGLIITLKAALEICKFLVEECSFTYLMTARLNQDALERFFGLVRQSSGANSHPEPKVFVQLFKLLSIYSLVKPLKGSNITGGEMLSTLINMEDLKATTAENRKQLLEEKLDDILLQGENLDHIPDLLQSVSDHDHLYNHESVDEFALAHFGRFVARHSKKYTKGCKECQESIIKPNNKNDDTDMLINEKSRGYLCCPTDQLMNMLRIVEDNGVQGAKAQELEQNILFCILERLENATVPHVGCAEHKEQLSHSILKYFLITRMHFICRRWNKVAIKNKKKQRLSRKSAHLC